MKYLKNKFKDKTKKQKGFTLLFAVLVSTLVISISATVMSIALRQTIISGTSRESQFAFYATNTVMECAFYWDIVGSENLNVGPIFPAPNESRNSPFSSDGITCAGGNIVDGANFKSDTLAPGSVNANFTRAWVTTVLNETTFYIEVNDRRSSNSFNNPYCAEAKVKKSRDPSTGIVTTTIEAKGYNTCDLNSPRAVERGLVQSYQS